MVGQIAVGPLVIIRVQFQPEIGAEINADADAKIGAAAMARRAEAAGAAGIIQKLPSIFDGEEHIGDVKQPLGNHGCI